MACAQVEDAVLIASDRRVTLLDGHTLARLPEKGRGESGGYAGSVAVDHPVGLVCWPSYSYVVVTVGVA
jgi:hypothetical protein